MTAKCRVICNPYPWFGGKTRIARAVWDRLGADVRNFVDPFMGGNAFLIQRPGWNWDVGQWEDGSSRTETVNDVNGYVSNFWRAVRDDPNAVAHYANWPVNENDLHARHVWLVNRRDELREQLEGDPEWYDAKIAGWWVWGMSIWSGRGFCSGNGGWMSIDGRMVNAGGTGLGVWRQRVRLDNTGIQRKRIHFGDTTGGQCDRSGEGIMTYIRQLSDRIRLVRVACGDWTRVLGRTPTEIQGLTGIVLDPPYNVTMRKKGLYTADEVDISDRVREWAIEHGDNPKLRIALFGYDGEHEMPTSWDMMMWKAHGGFGVQTDAGRGRENSHKERVWFSPHCVGVAL